MRYHSSPVDVSQNIFQVIGSRGVVCTQGGLNLSQEKTKSFDYIVVGAGSAGCVIARRLVDAGKNVVVLEAGDYDVNPDIEKVHTLGLLWGSPQDWNYRTVPQPWAAGRSLHIPRGKVMGGSHALNATIWVRGAKQDYDTWAYLGNDGWSWEDVLPVFKSIENYDGGASEVRGSEGLLDVMENYIRHPLQNDLFQAAQEAGIPLNEDYNSGDVEGVGKIQANVRNGNRFNTWHAYLKPVEDASNLTIITSAHVHGLLVESGAILGVNVEVAGELQELRADETILCAGALNSPEILLRSGIGPAEELEALGIVPTHDLPGVGKNLHDHLLSPVIFTTTKKEVPVPEVLPAEVHVFSKSRPEAAVPDTQPLYFSIPMYNEGMEGPDNGFTLMGGIVRPASRGELTLTGPNPSDPIAIDFGALSVQADVDALVASVKQCREVGRQQALAEWGPEEVYPGPDVADEDLEDYVRSTAITYHHQVGTCKMGIDSMAVVDPRTLKVYGLEGIRIADASVMPLVPTGNTNAPSIMIAEKAAAFILG